MTAKDTVLLVGVARADITPPVGIKSAGFAGRGPLSRLHDPLLATAVVFAAGGDRVVLIGCDLLGLDAETVGEIRSLIEARTGIPGTAITVACTHTHYGPDPYRAEDDPLVQAYRANLIHTLAGIATSAASDLVPARVGVGWGASDVGINRREKRPDGSIVLGQNPGGPIDRSVGVVRIDREGGAPPVCIVNYQTHPVSQTGQVDHISADYPGKMREVVEQVTGATCLFLQGACGNINALRMEPRYEPARTLGVRLGCEVARVWEVVGPPEDGASPEPATEGPAIRVTSEVIDLPRTRYGSREAAAELVASLEQDVAALSGEDGNAGRLHWAATRLERARAALESWETGELPEPVPAEVQAWRVGDLAVVTAPGEIFNQIGVEIKGASPFAQTLFVGYANGSIGYVPVPEAYPEGGYEVTHASRVAPEAAGRLTDACLAALALLYEA